jgi:hypothetical protein
MIQSPIYEVTVFCTLVEGSSADLIFQSRSLNS